MSLISDEIGNWVAYWLTHLPRIRPVILIDATRLGLCRLNGSTNDGGWSITRWS